MSNNLNNQTTKKKKNSYFNSNPVMNGLNKVNERTSAGSLSASYGGIAVKTVFFLLMVVVGIMLYLVLNNLVFTNAAYQGEVFTLNYDSLEYQVSTVELAMFGAVTVVGIICQILACFVAPTIPVTGSLFSVCEGFFISFTIFKILKGYEYLGMLALMVTVLVVMVMNLLYAKQIIRATHKFRMVMVTLFATVIGISILMTIGFLIPFTRPIVGSVMANPAISIAFTVISVAIAALFLISDFAMIDTVVNENYPKKYEWRASFGLAFTVIWLYVKILDLIIQIFVNSRDN